MSKKPKTPDVAAVWQEVKGISNGLAALRITVACNENDAKKDREHTARRFEHTWADIRTANAFAGGLRDMLEKDAEAIRKHEAWITGLQNAEIDAQAVGEQIGDLQVEVDNLKPLHTAVSMLEAKVAALTDPRSQSEAMLDQARSNHVDSVFNYTQATNRRMDAMQSVVTVLVIVQVFTVIAGLAWVLGVQ